jgi:hypothetical protein
MTTISFTGTYKSFNSNKVTKDNQTLSLGTLDNYSIQSNIYGWKTIKDIVNALPSNFYSIDYYLFFTINFNYVDRSNWFGLNSKCHFYLDNNEIKVIDEGNVDFRSGGQYRDIKKLNFSANSPFNINYKGIIYWADNINLAQYNCGNDLDTMDFTLIILVTVKIQEYCTTNLESSICQRYCNETPSLCVQPAINYCFDGTLSYSSKLLTSSFCPNFIQTVLSRNDLEGSPNLIIDNKINQLCKGLGVTPSNYKNITQGGTNDLELDAKVRDLCACHFDQEVYDNFYDQVIQKYPVLAGIATKQCLFPECTGSSRYKSFKMLGSNVCPSISCINVATINNNGTIDGPLTIEQTNVCKVLVGEGTGPQCTTNIDCPTNYKCLLNQCIPVGQCLTSSDCDPSEKCIQGTCKPIDSCVVSRDCLNGKKCLQGTCVEQSVCFKDEDCPDGLVCTNKVCSPKTTTLPWIIGGVSGGVVVLLLLILGFILIFKKPSGNS